MAAIPFSLTPATVEAGVLDYSTAENRRLYQAATKSLSDDTTGLFDGTADELSAFLHKIKTRAIEHGWYEGGITDVQADMAAAVPVYVNLIDRYGELTVDQVRAHVATYINVRNRAAQDSMQLYNC